IVDFRNRIDRNSHLPKGLSNGPVVDRRFLTHRIVGPQGVQFPVSIGFIINNDGQGMAGIFILEVEKRRAAALDPIAVIEELFEAGSPVDPRSIPRLPIRQPGSSIFYPDEEVMFGGKLVVET